MSVEHHHYINGTRKAGDSQRTSEVYNPATGEIQAKVSLANELEVKLAVQAAKAAFDDWRDTPPSKRSQIMFNFRDLLIKYTNDLAELISKEHGKTLPDAIGEIGRGLEVVEFACGIPHLLKGEYTENAAKGVDVYSSRQPLGICVGITPFNFPAMVPLWMFPIAIACGNTFILKPSERDPACSIRLAELMTDAGLPDGVLNLVNGDKQAVDALLHDADVKGVSFVGSTPIGQYIYSTGCANGKRVQALCGAKNHMVIMPDADMDQVVDATMGAAFGSAGERCMAISAIVPVGQKTADDLLEALIPRIRSLKIGPYTDSKSEMGPVINQEAYKRITDFIESGISQGAELLVDGRDPRLQGYENGFFLGGCLFDRVTTSMDIYRKEIFGPVLSTVRVENYDEAIAMINSHAYGNGTAIFTRDGDAARDFSNKIEIGMVGVNVPIPVPVAYHSFGGWKDSLFGDHSMHGMEGVRFYTRLKTVTSRWPSGVRTGASFNFSRSSEA